MGEGEKRRGGEWEKNPWYSVVNILIFRKIINT